VDGINNSPSIKISHGCREIAFYQVKLHFIRWRFFWAIWYFDAAVAA